MAVRVDVKPAVLEWAVRRSGRSEEDLWNKSNPRSQYEAWLRGEKRPTYRQLENFARRTYTPFGYLLLEEPVDEPDPIADFRVLSGTDPASYSANLRDAIYESQGRLDWWSEHRRIIGEPPAALAGSTNASVSPVEAAHALAQALDWTAEVRGSCGSWERVLAELRDRVEVTGIIVVISGVVRGNPHRPLSVDEFRGFALVENGDALIFVNGRDAKTAQIFTLVHELAHVVLGEEGVSKPDVAVAHDLEIERWCNAVAAEFLVPAAEFRQEIGDGQFRREDVDRLARHFRVSGQVVLGRFRELGMLDWSQFMTELEVERKRVAALLEQRGSSGGNFYNSRPVQLSKTFTAALIGSTLEGHTSYTEAFRLLGIKKSSTFDALGEHLGLI